MLQKRKILLYVSMALVILLIGFFVYYYRGRIGKILSPFIMALIIAYLLHPLVVKLTRRKFPCNVSILLLYAFFILLAASIIIFIIPELMENSKELATTIPDITRRYQNMLDGFLMSVQSSDWSPDIKNVIFREMQNGLAVVQDYVLNLLKKSMATLLNTVTTMFDVILALIIAYYFIKDAVFFREVALSIIPRRWRNWFVGTGREVNSILSNFIQGQMLTAVIVGTMETIGLFAVNVKYPLVLGVVGGLANIIPYFGPIIGAIPAVAIALIDSPVKALWTALVFVIVQQIDNAFISPKIIEGKLGLHPVTTILAVLVGGEFFGILGMLVAVPVLAILKAILKRSIEAIV